MFKFISNIIYCFMILPTHKAYAGIGLNTWDDNREPWENDSSSFSAGEGLFALIVLVVSFFLSIYIYTVIEDILPEGLKAIHLVIIPGIFIYSATCYNSGSLNIFAFGSVVSAIYYSAILRQD